MALYSGQHGEGAGRTVAFKDTDGDAIVFAVNENGKLNYYVNNNLKVKNLTRLSSRDGTIHLDGTSVGSWSSSRVTTPHNRQTLSHVMKLARGTGL